MATKVFCERWRQKEFLRGTFGCSFASAGAIEEWQLGSFASAGAIGERQLGSFASVGAIDEWRMEAFAHFPPGAHDPARSKILRQIYKGGLWLKLYWKWQLFVASWATPLER